jgi:hypothetical protein
MINLLLMKTKPLLLLIAALFVIFNSCYSLKRSSGGGERINFEGERPVNAADIALPEGYSIEMIASGFTFPTGICFDEAGTPFVVEAGYSYGEVFTEPTLKKINPDGSVQIIARGNRNGRGMGFGSIKKNFIFRKEDKLKVEK